MERERQRGREERERERERRERREREGERRKKSVASAGNEPRSHAPRCTLLDDIHQRDCHLP